MTFHDLRHEAGSRAGTYLYATRVGLQDAIQRFDASCCNPVANNSPIDPMPLRNGEQQETEQATVN